MLRIRLCLALIQPDWAILTASFDELDERLQVSPPTALPISSMQLFRIEFNFNERLTRLECRLSSSPSTAAAAVLSLTFFFLGERLRLSRLGDTWIFNAINNQRQQFQLFSVGILSRQVLNSSCWYLFLSMLCVAFDNYLAPISIQWHTQHCSLTSPKRKNEKKKKKTLSDQSNSCRIGRIVEFRLYSIYADDFLSTEIGKFEIFLTHQIHSSTGWWLFGRLLHDRIFSQKNGRQQRRRLSGIKQRISLNCYSLNQSIQFKKKEPPFGNSLSF